MKWWVQHRILSSVEERRLAQHLGSTLHGTPKADLFLLKILHFSGLQSLWDFVLVIIPLLRVWFWNSYKYSKFVQIACRPVNYMNFWQWNKSFSNINDSSQAFKRGGRPDARKVMIVITDGESHDSPDLKKAVEESEKDNITLYGIAVSLLYLYHPFVTQFVLISHQMYQGSFTA